MSYPQHDSQQSQLTCSLSWSPQFPPPEELECAEIVYSLSQFLEELGHGQAVVSVWLGNNHDLQQWNHHWLSIDAPTDVLCWPYHGDIRQSAPLAAGTLLGDLAVSLEMASVQKQEQVCSLQSAVLRLLAHGCAHAVGWDHGTVEERHAMQQVERQLLDVIGLGDLMPLIESVLTSAE